MIGVPVELDGQPRASALDYQVNAESTNLMLDLDPVSARDEVAVDVTLEV